MKTIFNRLNTAEVVHGFVVMLFIIGLILIGLANANAQNWNQIIKAAASDRGALSSQARSNDDLYGVSVAMDGNYAVVGASRDEQYDENYGDRIGAAYILYNNAGNWTQIKKIRNTEGSLDDYFGEAVAISGDYVIVGAAGEDDDANSLNNAGSVYVYKKDQGGTNNWGLVKQITAGTRGAEDYFGSTISISGDYLVVGVSADDEDASEQNTLDRSGSVYVFKKGQGGADNWGQIKKITASSRAEQDSFGNSVSISGNYLVVGCQNDDEDATEGNTLNNSGSAYIFSKDQGGTDNWGQIKKITSTIRAANDIFGGSVAISGNTIIVGAGGESEDTAEANTLSYAGAVYIFNKDQGGTDNWGQIKKVTAITRAANAGFGMGRIAISGSYAIIGFAGDSDSGKGSAHIVNQNEGGSNNWGVVKMITANPRANDDYFGRSVAISGEYALIGALGEDEDETETNTRSNAGAAYVLKKDQGGVNNWGQTQKLVTLGTSGLNYGRSIAMDGNYVVVGAIYNDYDVSGGNIMSDAGAAYILYNNAGTWQEIKKITASDRAVDAHFGDAVAIWGDYVIVSATREAKDASGLNPLSNAGAVYIFNRNEGGANNWGLVKKITATVRKANDRFGNAVAISGDYIVAGASNEDEDAEDANTLDDSGSAYVYKKDQGGVNNWGLVKKLTASIRSDEDNFGESVSISDNSIIVGSPYEDEDAADANFTEDSGAAYVFSKDQGGNDNWGQISKVTATVRGEYDNFGYSVSISGDYAVVGSVYDSEDEADANTIEYSGSAYILNKNSGGANTWGHVKKITAITRTEDAGFGTSVSISNDKVIVGSPDEDGGGAAYLFQKDQSGVDNWGAVQKLISSDIADNDNFGSSVSISGDYAIVSAPNQATDANGENPINGDGALYIFASCDQPVISSTTPATRCSSGSVTLAATANLGILNWYAASTGGASLGTGTSFITPSISTITTYYVDATNACSTTSARTAVAATIGTSPATPQVSLTQPTCSIASGTITVTVQNATDTYSFDNGATFQSGNSKSGLASGDYSMIIKNTSGCSSAVTSATINAQPVVPTTPVATITQPTCAVATGTIVVTVQNANDTYSFDNGVTFQSGNSKSELASGNYSLIIKSTSGCSSAVTSATINSQPVAPTTPVATITQPTCTVATGTIVATVQNANDTYSFDNGITFQSDNSKSGLTSGNYSLIIKNTSGCSSAVTAATINAQPAVPTTPVATITQPTCTALTGTIVATVQNANDTYSFDNGVTYQSSNSKSGLASGNYSLLIKNLSGCSSAVASATINAQPVAPTTPLTTITQPNCSVATGTIAVSVQNAGDTYSFDNGVTFQSSNSKSGLPSGNYTLFIKNSAGCTSSVAATVNNQPATPDKPSISLSESNPEAPLLTASSASAYQWYKDGVIINGATSVSYTVPSPGSYTVVVFSSNGCASTPSNPQTIIITGIEDNLGELKIELYPNPATEWLTLSFPTIQGIKYISIFDSNGKQTYGGETSANEVSFQVAQYATGPYFIQFKSEKSAKSLRFLKR